MNSAQYLGLEKAKHGALAHAINDGHKDTNSICMYDTGDSSFFAEARLDMPEDNICKYLKKQTKDFTLKGKELVIGYEAGPTGFGLQRGFYAKRYVKQFLNNYSLFKESPLMW